MNFFRRWQARRALRRADRAQLARLAAVARGNRLLTRALDWQLQSLAAQLPPKLAEKVTLAVGAPTKSLALKLALRLFDLCDRRLLPWLTSGRWATMKGRLLGRFLLSLVSAYRRTSSNRSAASSPPPAMTKTSAGSSPPPSPRRLNLLGRRSWWIR